MAVEPLPSVESLESRKLMAASTPAFAGVHRDVLIVDGTHKADSITLELGIHSNATISVTENGVTEQFSAKGLTGILVLAGQGNDYVFVDNTDPHLDEPVTIYGSGGKDTLIGGAGRDRIYGGDDNDSIKGANGVDVLYGGEGADTIDGGQGSDYIDGQGGNDSLVGGPGLDYLYGSGGNDTIIANDGSTDHVDGGSGTDTAIADKVDEILVSIEAGTVSGVEIK